MRLASQFDDERFYPAVEEMRVFYPKLRIQTQGQHPQGHVERACLEPEKAFARFILVFAVCHQEKKVTRMRCIFGQETLRVKNLLIQNFDQAPGDQIGIIYFCQPDLIINGFGTPIL